VKNPRTRITLASQRDGSPKCGTTRNDAPGSLLGPVSGLHTGEVTLDGDGIAELRVATGAKAGASQVSVSHR
jgi:hypothetical protein